MATVQKFAALPFDKYLTLLEKVKEQQESAPVTHPIPPPVNYQTGKGISDSEPPYQSTDRAISGDSKQLIAPPPPGLPAGDGTTSDRTSDNSDENDNWVEVWQAL